jgi:hypothetical protein
MKKIIISLLITIGLISVGCSNKLEEKEKTEITSGKVANGLSIGQRLDFTIKNQFGKPISLQNSTKKIIFVFTKPTGHLVREYLKKQDKTFLSKRDILFVADVSGMPSIIFSMFALPDFQKSPYDVLLLEDKNLSKSLENEQHKNEVMIIELDNKIVKNVKFVSTLDDFVNEIY